jgi:hypothetical protein
MRIFPVLFLFVLLAACAPAATEAPLPTETPAPTNTPIPTATVIPSPTPTESPEEAAAHIARAVLAGETTLVEIAAGMSVDEIQEVHIAIANHLNEERSKKLVFPFTDIGDKTAYVGLTSSGWERVEGLEDQRLIESEKIIIPGYERNGKWYYHDPVIKKFVEAQGSFL